VTYDRRGFHRSPPREPLATLDLRDHVDDAVALLETLSASPAVVIGRSTGGQIALALAHRRPDVVRAIVLLEPALFTVDEQAAAWARDLRQRVLEAAARDPASAAEAVVREALGGETWESFPAELREMFLATGPAMPAEIAGHGLDLSADPWSSTPPSWRRSRTRCSWCPGGLAGRLPAGRRPPRRGPAARGARRRLRRPRDQPVAPLVLDFVDRLPA
jgi:pimeloyl-ACP methyl ester carboxylesterase